MLMEMGDEMVWSCGGPRACESKSSASYLHAKKKNIDLIPLLSTTQSKQATPHLPPPSCPTLRTFAICPPAIVHQTHILILLEGRQSLLSPEQPPIPLHNEQVAGSALQLHACIGQASCELEGYNKNATIIQNSCPPAIGEDTNQNVIPKNVATQEMLPFPIPTLNSRALQDSWGEANERRGLYAKKTPFKCSTVHHLLLVHKLFFCPQEKTEINSGWP